MLELGGCYRTMLPEHRLKMLLELPFAAETFRSPDCAVLPDPIWVKRKRGSGSRGREQLSVLELEVLHGHGRYSSWSPFRDGLPGAVTRPAPPWRRGHGTL